MKRDTYQRAIAALRGALTATRPGLTVAPSGYVNHWRENLLPDTDPTWFESELSEGDGGELKGKFKAAHSSSALAVNTFARFKTDPASLSLFDLSNFTTFQFEAKCDTGIRARGIPNLDLLGTGASVLGIKSKCTEHLKKHVSKFSTSYDDRIKDDDARRRSKWFRLMKTLMAEPRRYCYLDVAQLIKHAFGLAHCFPSSKPTLLYLYWEPRNAGAFGEFRIHQEEVSRFVEEVKGSQPQFVAASYRDLWDAWSHLRSPLWLRDHLIALRARYDIAI